MGIAYLLEIFPVRFPFLKSISITEYDAPEIDGVVNTKTNKHLVPGYIEYVRITAPGEYDLIGEI